MSIFLKFYLIWFCKPPCVLVTLLGTPVVSSLFAVSVDRINVALLKAVLLLSFIPS